MVSDRLLLKIPTDLVLDQRLPMTAKSLYMTLVQQGPCSVLQLSVAAGLTRQTTKKLACILLEAGWVKIGGSRNCRVVVATQPEATRVRLFDNLIETRTNGYPVGESLTGLVLDVVVDDDQYINHARLSFLQNRKTGEYMELDRWYYRRRWGEEYEGIQHFQVTQGTDAAKLREIQERDAAKAAICRAKNIPLMIVTEDDLSIDGILAKLPPGLPKARFDRDDPYVLKLNELCEDYVASCRRARARDARNQSRTQGGGNNAGRSGPDGPQR